MNIITLDNLAIPKCDKTIAVRPELKKWLEIELQPPKNYEMRKIKLELIHLAAEYTSDVLRQKTDVITESAIVSGHQAQWHSPGVWIKTALAEAVGRKTNSVAIQLVLDHDIYSTALEMPAKIADGGYEIRKMPIEKSNPTLPVEFRTQQGSMKDLLDAAKHYFPNACVNKFFAGSDADNIPKMPADAITYFQAKINQYLGLNVLYLPVSIMSQTDIFYSFAVDIINKAHEFSDMYNAAIEKNKSVNALRKLSDGQLTELPFWIVSADKGRRTAYVKSEDDKITIYAADEPVAKFDCITARKLQKHLAPQGLGIRPKAITLTLFVRLFLADLFIHGIGGAKYEVITDYLIANFYNVQVNPFTTATMTLRLFDGQYQPNIQSQISKAKGQLRDITFNPQNYISPEFKLHPAVKKLVAKKKVLLDVIAANHFSVEQKRDIHQKTQDINSQLLAYTSGTAKLLESRIQQLESDMQSDNVYQSRDYFFGLFDEIVLKNVIKSIDEYLMEESAGAKSVNCLPASR